MMNFFLRFVFISVCVFFFSTSIFGMAAEPDENTLYNNAVQKVFQRVSKQGEDLRAYAEAPSDPHKNTAVNKSFFKLFSSLEEDFIAQEPNDKWLENFGLSKAERGALQEKYKNLCQRLSQLDKGQNLSEKFSFSKSYHLLNELFQGSYGIDKKVRQEAFFAAVFYDLLKFKRQKAEKVIVELMKIRDYFFGINYQDAFIETYQSLLMVNELGTTPVPSLEKIQSNIQRRIKRDFNPQFFSQEDLETIERCALERISEWYEDQRQFKELSLPAIRIHLEELALWPQLDELCQSLGSSHLKELRDFVENLRRIFAEHLGILRDILDKKILTPQKPESPFEFSIDHLKAAFTVPTILGEPSFCKGGLFPLLKSEIGLENLEFEGTPNDSHTHRTFVLSNLKYQISPDIVRLFSQFIWPIIPQNTRIDDVAKPGYVPIYTCFEKAERDALQAHIKILQKEITKLRGTVSEQAVVLKGFKSQNAFQELMDEEEPRGSRKAGKQKASSISERTKGGTASGHSSLSKPAQKEKTLEELTQIVGNLNKEIEQKTKELRESKEAGKKRAQKDEEFKKVLCDLTQIEGMASLSLAEILEIINKKWKELHEKLKDQERRLSTQTSQEQLKERLQTLQKTLEAQTAELESLRAEKRQHIQEKERVTERILQQISQAMGMTVKKRSGFDAVIHQIQSQLGTLRKTIEEQKRALSEKDAFLKKAIATAESESHLKRVNEEQAQQTLALRGSLCTLIDEKDSSLSFDALIGALKEKMENLKKRIQEESEKQNALQGSLSAKERSWHAERENFERASEQSEKENSTLRAHVMTQEKILRNQMATIASLKEENAGRKGEVQGLTKRLEERDQAFQRIEAEKKRDLDHQRALEASLAQLQAQVRDLTQKGSSAISADMFKVFQQEFYSLKGDMMSTLQKLMQGIPDKDRKLLGTVQALEDLYLRCSGLFPPIYIQVPQIPPMIPSQYFGPPPRMGPYPSSFNSFMQSPPGGMPGRIPPSAVYRPQGSS
ncbi:MAG: hypothetical protein JSS34_05340 [Proteobacteria bacterium]|nr:hypothetical protein [Pseudomonadota bacterium]